VSLISGIWVDVLVGGGDGMGAISSSEKNMLNRMQQTKMINIKSYPAIRIGLLDFNKLMKEFSFSTPCPLISTFCYSSITNFRD
jgi:hypothetical protein